MKPVKTAVALKNIQPRTGPGGDTGNTSKQTLFRLSPPLKGHKFVVVSTAFVKAGHPDNPGPKYPETMVFPSSPTGTIMDFSPLHETGGESHEEALTDLDYVVIDLR